MTIPELVDRIKSYGIPYTIREEYAVIYQNTKRMIGYCVEIEGKKFYGSYKQTVLLRVLRYLEEKEEKKNELL